MVGLALVTMLVPGLSLIPSGENQCRLSLLQVVSPFATRAVEMTIKFAEMSPGLHPLNQSASATTSANCKAE